MRGVVRSWGNSAAVRIPAAVLQGSAVKLDHPVDIREENGRIVIEAIEAPSLDIDAMIAAITPENRHSEVDWGPPVGREVF